MKSTTRYRRCSQTVTYVKCFRSDLRTLQALAEALKPTEYYGFNGSFTGYFRGVAESLPEILELPDPDVTPLAQRKALRLQSEEIKFDPEHYMCAKWL